MFVVVKGGEGKINTVWQCVQRSKKYPSRCHNINKYTSDGPPVPPWVSSLINSLLLGREGSWHVTLVENKHSVGVCKGLEDCQVFSGSSLRGPGTLWDDVGRNHLSWSGQGSRRGDWVGAGTSIWSWRCPTWWEAVSKLKGQFGGLSMEFFRSSQMW